MLATLTPDVAVLQEIARPKDRRSDVIWFGNLHYKGVAVVARPPFTIRALPTAEGVYDFTMPFRVTGPVDFTLFAVWTLGAPPLPYVQRLCKAVDAYADLVRAGPAVFIGDFNSNRIWDRAHPKGLNHSALVRRMDGLGLVSAYHVHHRVEHGGELENTFYLQGKVEKPYHIDYCFIPAAWKDSVKRAEIGTYEAWSHASDHRPLIVDLEGAGFPA